MRVVHTADWHVGKVLRGRGRHDEQRAVLDRIVDIARTDDADLVLIAGDVFDTATPQPPAQALVMRTLLALAEDGRQVVVTAGNHDDPRLLEVYRPVLGRLGVHVVGLPRGADDGGLLRLTTRHGEPATVAALPFVPHRHAVRAAEAATDSPQTNTATYAAHLRRAMADLAAGFRPDTVNLLLAHATLAGGTLGGGEREAQTVVDYHLPPDAFPATTSYAALGHLHRRQEIPGPCPLHYAGAPLQVDFGEAAHTPVVLLVEVSPGSAPKVTDRPIGTGRRLRTVAGDLARLAAQAQAHPDLLDPDTSWLRVIVDEPPRAGLADRVRELLPTALEVRLLRPPGPAGGTTADPLREHRPHSPHELFAGYLATHGIVDERLTSLFAQLLDEQNDQPADGAA
jgi:exonuclease SbcD